MKRGTNPQHPYVRHQSLIEERGVVVIDNITQMPQYGSAYIAPDLLMMFCHQGTMYNINMPDDEFGRHDVGVLLPNQIVMARHVSDDYQATMVAVSRKFYDELLHQYPYPRHSRRYRQHPAVHFTDEQFAAVMDAVHLLRSISVSRSPQRLQMLRQVVCVLLNMIGEYRLENHPEETVPTRNEMFFNRFYDAIIEHYRESREMAFYAKLLCVSPKHFSQVIKTETGISANKWISTYVILQAKSLMDSRRDLTIQQIASELGFTEQASFSRFFKGQAGISPTEYRSRTAYDDKGELTYGRKATGRRAMLGNGYSRSRKLK